MARKVASTVRRDSVATRYNKAGWKSIRVTVPATTANLGPGFDTIGLALSLRNELVVDPSPTSRLELTLRGRDAPGLPPGDDNLVLRAFRAFFNGCGLPVPAVHIAYTNRIPVARGLGSSAAAIVAGLVAARKVARAMQHHEGRASITLTGANAGRNQDVGELLDLAVDLEGHADNVAAALFGGLVAVATTHCAPKWSHVPCRSHPAPGLRVIAAVPGYHVRSVDARRVLPESVSYEDAVFNISRTTMLLNALTSGTWSILATAMEDRLHQPYRERLIPGLSKALRNATEAGAFGAALSGSGPTVVAFVPDDARVAERVKLALARAMATRDQPVECLDLVPELQGCIVEGEPGPE